MNIIAEAYAMGTMPRVGGELSKLTWFIKEFWPFIIIFILMISLAIYKKGWANNKAKTLDKQIQDLRQRILVVTSDNIHGKEVKHVIGSVIGVSKTPAASSAEFNLAEKEAVLDIINNAISIGANAITDLKMTTSTYEQQGVERIVSSTLYNKNMVSKIAYNGTAVRI